MSSKRTLYVSAALLVSGFLLWNASPALQAIGPGTESLYGCKVLSTSLLRMVNATSSCVAILETPVSWRVGPEQGTEFPLICGGCVLQGLDLEARNVMNSYFKNADLADADFSDTNLTNAILVGTNAEGANFTGANLTNANLYGMHGQSSSSFVGAIWSNTICPEGTNSNENGNTCSGLLE